MCGALRVAIRPTSRARCLAQEERRSVWVGGASDGCDWGGAGGVGIGTVRMCCEWDRFKLVEDFMNQDRGILWQKAKELIYEGAGAVGKK